MEIFYQKVLKPTKTSKKDHSFYNKVLLKKTSLILRTSTHLTLKIIGSRNIAKNLSDFTNFPANMFLFSFRKKVCTAPFLDAQEMHSWITLKANGCSVYLGKKNFIPKKKYDFTWWVRRGWLCGRLNNFFKAACCLGLVKCFTIFHFNWNFWKFNYFSAFWSSIFSIKTLEFSRQSVL